MGIALMEDGEIPKIRVVGVGGAGGVVIDYMTDAKLTGVKLQAISKKQAINQFGWTATS